MKAKSFFVLSLSAILLSGFCKRAEADTLKNDTVLISDTIIYHSVHLDDKGKIQPWFSNNLGQSYDTTILLVWNFWKNMELDSNGIPYYMNHQVWRKNHDSRGLGGDQFSMALSSWALLYAYTGERAVIENMKYLADYYLANSLSDSLDAWPYMPYPYNTEIHSGKYDGDMILKKGYMQPDKAGSFGFELIKLYKITNDVRYLNAAVKIANTMAGKVIKGDSDHSPWPFKVHAKTGELGSILVNNADQKASYTSNWTSTLEMFSELVKLNIGHVAEYRKTFDITLNWLKQFPLKTNKWGPFFEDVKRWSDTQINAVTLAMYCMNHPEYFPAWKENAKSVFNWVHNELGNHEYEKYGVTVTNEQTIYRVPGNSHSSRQASMEILYTKLSGDSTFFDNAVRMLNWATYMVDFDGKNRYPRDGIWMTDGYGDYVRHYLRAMAACPDLAPDNKNRLLESSSIVTDIKYSPTSITYETYDAASAEILRIRSKPLKVMAGDVILSETKAASKEGYQWKNLKTGGVLTLHHVNTKRIKIML